MKEYEVIKINVSKIKIDQDNPNKLSDDMKERLKQSMEEFGNTQPIVIDKKTMILADGYHRLQNYISEGLNEVPAILIPFKSDAHRRLFRQASNKIHGEHQQDLDMLEYQRIIDAGEKEWLQMATGMNYIEVEAHIRNLEKANKEEEFDVDAAVEEAGDPISKLGDIYVLGKHRLMCGDSTKSEDVALLMQEDKPDLLLTDPPYGINIVKNNNKIGFGNGRLGFKSSSNKSPTGIIGGGGIVPVCVHKKIIGDDKPFNPEFLIQYGSNQIIWGGNYYASKLKDTSC